MTTATFPSTVPESFTELTALDRCDSCSARALARVVKREEGLITGQLTFCGHHLNKYSEALTDQGFTVC